MMASRPVLGVAKLVLVFSVAGGGARNLKLEPCDGGAPDGECTAAVPAQSAIQRGGRAAGIHALEEDDAQRGGQAAGGGAGEAAEQRWGWSWPWEKKAEPPRNFIQFDASHKTPVPRKEVDGFVREVVFRYGLADGLVSLSDDGKRVHIPFEKMLEAPYSRDTSVSGRSDFGVQKAMVFRSNQPSIVSDRSELTFMEKTHVLYSSVPDSDFPKWTKRAAKKEREGRWWATRHAASHGATRAARDFSTNLYALSGFAKQVKANGVADLTAKEDVRKFVEAHGGLSQQERARIDEVSARLADRAAGARETPIRSGNACMHFENSDAIAYRGDGVDITLGRKMVTYRGRLIFSPNEEYDFILGYGVFYHNEAANSIDLYVAGSHMLEMSRAEHGWNPSLWVGRADGASWPRSPEGRPPTPELSTAAKTAYHAMSALPVDFEFLYKDRRAANCPDSALKQLEKDSDAIVHTLQKRDLSSLAQLTNMLKCGVEYLRPDDGGHNVGYNFLEAIGFAHVAMEIPPRIIAESMGAHIDWNTVKGVEAHKP